VPLANIPTLALYVVLGTATLTSVAIALSALTTTVESASALGQFSVVTLSFISGIWIPISDVSSTLQKLGHFFPISHLAEGIQSALSTTAPRHGLDGATLFSLLIWMAVCAAIAVRRFHWEPQGR